METLDLGHHAALLLAATASTLVLSLVVAFRAPIARKTGLLDDASKKAHAAHEGKVPLVGGVAWLAGAYTFVATLVILAALSGTLDLHAYWPAFAFLLLVGMFFILGCVDDVVHLSPRLRLAMSVAFVGGLLLAAGQHFTLHGVRDPFLGVEVSFGMLSGAATILAVVVLVNALNMADGRNGIVAGLTIIWLIALASKTSDIYLTAALMAGIANSLVLGWHNLRGRLFFGDSGTYAIAACFGVAAIFLHSGQASGGSLTSLQVCALFEILVLDMLRLIVIRVRAGRSPMAADRNHLHHRLDDRFGWPAGLLAYLALAGLPVVFAFQPFEGAGATAVALGGAAYWLVILLTRPATSAEPRPGGELVSGTEAAE